MNVRKAIRNPVFRSILLSYFAVCILLLGITGFGYVRSFSYIGKEIERSASFQLQNVVTQMKGRIEQTYKICDALAEGTDLAEVCRIEGDFTPEQILKTNDLKAAMGKIDIQRNLYENLHVYFYNSHSIVSERTQRRAGEADIELFAAQYGLRAGELLRLFETEGGAGWRILDGNRVWFLRPVYGENQRKEAMIFAEFDAEKLAENTGEGTILLIQTEEGFLTCSGSPKGQDAEILLNGGERLEEVSLSQGRYVSLGREIGVFGWNCRMAVPNTLFWSEMRGFCLTLGLELAVFFAAALLLSWYFSGKTYLPMGALMKDNRSLTKRISRNERILRTVELTGYLTGENTEETKFMELLKGQIGLEREDACLVCLLTLGEESRELFGEEGREKDLNSFVLENILGEQVFSESPGILIPLGRSWAVILRMDKGEAGLPEIREDFQKVVQFYRENFSLSLCVLMGRLSDSAGKIKEELDVLEEGLQYLNFWGSREEPEGVFAYGEMIDTEENVNFSVYLKKSRKLLNGLESGDFQGACQELDAIYRETFPKDPRHLRYNIYRMYGLIGILVTTLDTYASREDAEFFEGLHYEERLFRIQSMEELLTESRKIFESIIQYKESRTKEGEPEWMQELLAYMESHYQDPNLNVSMLAGVFGISVPHLSRTFKSVMATGVLEYLHGVRLGHVKAILKNGGNIKNAAEAVGYTDAKALTRAFKRYEGITPSQYKELISKNGN